MIYPKSRRPEILELIRTALVYDDTKPPYVTHVNGLPISLITNKDGYKLIHIPGEGQVQISHVVWFLNTGEWPTLQVDHKDDDRTNNKFGNLQELTHAENNGRRSQSHLERLA